MLITLSRIVVLALGAAICLASIWGMVAPRQLVTRVKAVAEANLGLVFAASIRLLLGAACIVVAPTSKFPTVFLVLGWIAIIAAVGIVLMGRERFKRFVNWLIEKFTDTIIRVWLLFGIAFGAFMIYAVI